MKKKVICIFLFVFLPFLSHAEIARDTYTVSALDNSNISRTISYENAGDFIVAWIVHESAGAHGSATYNGDSMTYIGTAVSGGDGNMRADGFYILSPDIGTYDLVISYAGSPANNQVWIASYTGVSTYDSFDVKGDHGTSISSSITLSNDGWVVALGYDRTIFGSAVGTGVISKVYYDETLSSGLFDSGETVLEGANAYGFSGAGNNDTFIFGVSFNPPSASPSPTPTVTATTTALGGTILLLYTSVGIFLIQLFAVLVVILITFMIVGYPIKSLVKEIIKIIKRADR